MSNEEKEPEIGDVTDEAATGSKRGCCGDDEHFAKTRARFNEAFEEAEEELKEFAEEAREGLSDLGEKAREGLETLRSRVAEFLDDAPWETSRKAKPEPESPPAAEAPPEGE
jgi:hypothetical protein